MNPPSAPPPTRRYIRDLRPSERVRGMFTLANAQVGRTRNDKPYLRCLVGDKSGDMAGRMWSIDERVMERLATDCFVLLEGETQAYQGEMQLIIQNLEPVEPTPDQLRELIPCSKRDPEEMFAELVAILDTLQHPAMKALAKAYLSDAMLMAAL
jgi:3'-5' exoribonuclease